MESDAFFVLVLALLAFDLGKVEPWVLASGLLRYLFVAGGILWPWLQRPLPASRRRRMICALQAGLLVACLAPVVPPALGSALAALGLAALVLSFAIDSVGLCAARKLGDTT
jgi:phosphatidylglycerophosphate synthase